MPVDLGSKYGSLNRRRIETIINAKSLADAKKMGKLDKAFNFITKKEQRIEKLYNFLVNKNETINESREQNTDKFINNKVTAFIKLAALSSNTNEFKLATDNKNSLFSASNPNQKLNFKIGNKTICCITSTKEKIDQILEKTNNLYDGTLKQNFIAFAQNMFQNSTINYKANNKNPEEIHVSVNDYDIDFDFLVRKQKEQETFQQLYFDYHSLLGGVINYTYTENPFFMNAEINKAFIISQKFVPEDLNHAQYFTKLTEMTEIVRIIKTMSKNNELAEFDKNAQNLLNEIPVVE